MTVTVSANAVSICNVNYTAITFNVLAATYVILCNVWNTGTEVLTLTLYGAQQVRDEIKQLKGPKYTDKLKMIVDEPPSKIGTLNYN
jgi:hypothetical protein